MLMQEAVSYEKYLMVVRKLTVFSTRNQVPDKTIT